MRRTWPILATLFAALAVSMGSAGLRALHVATSLEHAAHGAAHAHAERTAAQCGHSHGHTCGSEREAPVHHGHSHDSGSHGPGSHDAECATCELLISLSSEIMLLAHVSAPASAAGDAPIASPDSPAVRTLASVRARPPPAA